MSYQKFVVDNTVCSRRFHLRYNDQDPLQKQVEIKCPYCDSLVYTATDHPPVVLARQENLVQTAELSDELRSQCNFRDNLAPKK